MLDVVLASYPRSGVTFLRHVIEQLYGVRTLTVYRGEASCSDGLFDGDRLLQPVANYYGLAMRIIKSHEIYDRELPWSLHLIRDGRDALCSHARFEVARGTRTSEGAPWERADILRRLVCGNWPHTGAMRAGVDIHWNWGKHTQSWMDSSHSIAIRFEDLIVDPARVVREAMSKLPVRLPERGGEIAGFDELKDKAPRLFSKGQVGIWREEMSDELEDLFWRNHGHAMTAAGHIREEACVV